VDFHTTRETAPRFASWYQERQRASQLHGSCVAPTPASLPMASAGDVRVDPVTTAAREADLYRDLTHGFLVMNAEVFPSPGLTAGLLHSQFVVEIANGKPKARIAELQMAFNTRSVLRAGLTALGDATTLGTAVATTFKGMPWQTMTHPVTAPAAQCKEVDILRTDLSR